MTAISRPATTEPITVASATSVSADESPRRPRGPISLVAAARALALIRGRDYVVPGDMEALVRDAFRHRLVLSYRALAEEVSPDCLLDQVLVAVPTPQIDLGRREAVA